MAKKNSALSVIADWIIEENVTEKLLVRKRVEGCVDKPSYAKLLDQYYNQKTNYTLSKAKDKAGIRDAFSLSPQEICIISKATDIIKVRRLEVRQELDILSRQKTKNKLEFRRLELAGQQSLDFLNSEVKK